MYMVKGATVIMCPPVFVVGLTLLYPVEKLPIP